MRVVFLLSVALLTPGQDHFSLYWFLQPSLVLWCFQWHFVVLFSGKLDICPVFFTKPASYMRWQEVKLFLNSDNTIQPRPDQCWQRNLSDLWSCLKPCKFSGVRCHFNSVMNLSSFPRLALMPVYWLVGQRICISYGLTEGIEWMPVGRACGWTIKQ